MVRSWTVPPQAQAAFSREASDSIYFRPMFEATSWTTITVLPPRCAVSRRSTTRPNLEGLGTDEGSGRGGAGCDWPAGRLEPSSAAKGFCRPRHEGDKSSLGFLAMRLIRGGLEPLEFS